MFLCLPYSTIKKALSLSYLNIQKTKAMFFNFKQQQSQPTPDIKINDTLIECVNSFKFHWFP